MYCAVSWKTFVCKTVEWLMEIWEVFNLKTKLKSRIL